MAFWVKKAAAWKAATRCIPARSTVDHSNQYGIPHFAISIGPARRNRGGRADLQSATTICHRRRGKGAFLNDQRLRVAARRRLDVSVIACGLPHLGRGDLALSAREITAVQPKVAGLRRFGAAALDLAWVAAGRLDAYWERNLSPWDIAAGLIMVREAGGYVTDLDGKEPTPATVDVLAGNETIHGEMLKVLKAAGKA
jgi:myo-inositol-1(or 4)-monophosphatase